MKAYYPPKMTKKARKAYEEWAAVNQTSKPYEGIEGSAHVGGKTKKRVNTIFNKLPGL